MFRLGSSPRAARAIHLSDPNKVVFRTVAYRVLAATPTSFFAFKFCARQPLSFVRPTTIINRLRQSRLFHSVRRRLDNKPSPVQAESPGLAMRLKKLGREYGWSAFGVYLALSAIDFPFCYLLVRYLGTDKIGEWEHIIVSNVKRLIPERLKEMYHDWRVSVMKSEREVTGHNKASEHIEMVGWGLEQAEAQNNRDASLATQLALAYAIHKSFIFVRVPLTAALTPRIVKMLRGWGWDIGKRTTKEAKAMKRAQLNIKSKQPKIRRFRFSKKDK